MPATHFLLALSVVFVWGTSFVVIRLGLDGMSPLWLATLRMALCCFPWVLFIPRPAAPWRKIALFGALLGLGQFGLLFLAMRKDISPGLASLVIQSQVFFTLGLSLVILGERLRMDQLAGLLLAVGGLGVIALNLDASVTLLGVGMVLGVAFFWACANLLVKSLGPVNMLHFMVWSCLLGLPLMVALAWAVEGPQALVVGLQHAGWVVWGSVLWQALGNTLFGYGVWNWLMARHPAATVSPLGLMVPIVGMATSALALGEALPGWKLGAAALVLCGLAVIICWPLLQTAWRREARVG